MELAQAYRRFGSRVTIVETRNQFASREDRDVAAALLEMSTDEGIAVRFGANILHVAGQSGKASVLLCAHRTATRPSKAATYWSRSVARPTHKGSGSTLPASRSMLAATSLLHRGQR